MEAPDDPLVLGYITWTLLHCWLPSRTKGALWFMGWFVVVIAMVTIVLVVVGCRRASCLLLVMGLPMGVQSPGAP
jgi:hypothetical protein